MANQMLWGFGAVKFVEGANVKELPDCYGTLGFREIKQRYRTKAKTTIIRHEGYRPIITIRMLNIGANTATAGQMAGLMQMLTNAKQTGIIIYPRFEGGGSIGYLCELVSDIEPKDFSQNVAAGQELNLVFEGMATVESLPTFISNPGFGAWIDGSGNNFVDKDGNRFVFVTK